jgi:hypothetical protein
VRSEAAGAGLFVGQEGHAGAEDVIGKGAAVGVGGRLGSFSGGAAPGDYQRTERLDMPSRPVGAPWARPDWRAGLVWSRGSSSPVMARRARSLRTSLARSTMPGQADGDPAGFWPIVKPPPVSGSGAPPTLHPWCRGPCGLAAAAWTVGKTPRCWRSPVTCSPWSTCGETAARRKNPPRSLARRPVPISTAKPLASQWLTLDRSMTHRS